MSLHPKGPTRLTVWQRALLPLAVLVASSAAGCGAAPTGYAIAYEATSEACVRAEGAILDQYESDALDEEQTFCATAGLRAACAHALDALESGAADE